ncbi:DUF739 family protein [Veillonella sp.]|uniref:DUF739 family protein n=1 Tax=Veillonella sp. TaxID=1926307 RepID=UPI0025EB68D5|nr:DUF739 family protein [Veillonella sp.]
MRIKFAISWTYLFGGGDLLYNLIQKKGLKLSFIANKLGITRYSLYNKLEGKTEFKASEIKVLIELLSLKAKDVIKIFFT